MEIGKKLREAREEKGLTIEELQERTKIRKKYLKAIENDNYDPIPGKVYVKAFIKGYAEEVDVNGQELIQQYQNWVEEKNKEQEKEEQVEEYESSLSITLNNILHNKIFKVLIIIILLALIGFVFYTFFWANSTTNNASVPVSETEQKKIVKNDNTSTEKINTSTNENQNKSNNNVNSNNETNSISDSAENKVKETENKQNKKSIVNNLNTNDISNKTENNGQVINNTVKNKTQDKSTISKEDKVIKIIAEERSWLQLSIDNQNTFQGFIDKGEVKKYKGDSKLTVKIGNGVAVKIEIGDKIYGPWGQTGEVIKKEISLE